MGAILPMRRQTGYQDLCDAALTWQPSLIAARSLRLYYRGQGLPIASQFLAQAGSPSHLRKVNKRGNLCARALRPQRCTMDRPLCAQRFSESRHVVAGGGPAPVPRVNVLPPLHEESFERCRPNSFRQSGHTRDEGGTSGTSGSCGSSRSVPDSVRRGRADNHTCCPTGGGYAQVCATRRLCGSSIQILHVTWRTTLLRMFRPQRIQYLAQPAHPAQKRERRTCQQGWL